MESRNLYFCRGCVDCNDCFGCVNLRNASYCIFNKKYPKEEYKNEIEKFKLNTIIGIKNSTEKSQKILGHSAVKISSGFEKFKLHRHVCDRF